MEGEGVLLRDAGLLGTGSVFPLAEAESRVEVVRALAGDDATDEDGLIVDVAFEGDVLLVDWTPEALVAELAAGRGIVLFAVIRVGVGIDEVDGAVAIVLRGIADMISFTVNLK